MGGSATLTGMYGVIYFTGQRIAAQQMATIAKQEQAQVQACCAHQHVPSDWDGRVHQPRAPPLSVGKAVQA
jgi:hypothetical protein